jgi:hypothetical protein
MVGEMEKEKEAEKYIKEKIIGAIKEILEEPVSDPEEFKKEFKKKTGWDYKFNCRFKEKKGKCRDWTYMYYKCNDIVFIDDNTLAYVYATEEWEHSSLTGDVNIVDINIEDVQIIHVLTAEDLEKYSRGFLF